MLETLKNEVFHANLDLVKHGLVLFTFGNASAIDRAAGLFVIKPSGVDYEVMKPEDMVVVDMNGKTVEGKLKPSSDMPTHLELYKAFANIGGITHTHSTYATAWAQAGRDIPFYGTTHADYFYGDIPCARGLTKSEVEKDYEKNTGLVIAERFKNTDPLAVPAVLVKSHGMFSFGKNADNAVFNAVVCEQVARMATLTEQITNENRQRTAHSAQCAVKDVGENSQQQLSTDKRADKYLLDKHYLRKHGKDAYYGQGTNDK